MTSAVDRIKAAAAGAAELEATRTRIAELAADLQNVRSAVLPLDAALKRVRAMVDGAALPRLSLQLFMREDAGPPRVDLTWLMQQEPSSTLLALCGAQIGAALEAQIKAAYGSGLRTLPAAERQKRVASLEDQVFDLELLEERLVRRLEAAGTEPDRRADARPEVVLATLEED